MNTVSPARSEHLSEEHDSEDLVETAAVSSELDGLPLADRLFIEENTPEAITQEIIAQLLPNEVIFVLFQLNSSYTFTDEAGKSEKVPLWTIVTGTRLLLLAVSSRGQTYCDVFDQHAVFEYQNGLARDEIRIADRTITTGIWEGKRKLFKEAVSLFPLSEYEKYLYIAGVYLQREQYPEALPFLQTSLTVEPTIKAYLLLAYTYSRTGTPDKAIDILQQACHFVDPASIIDEVQELFADNLVMFLYLVVVCEKNQWWEHGITIYQHLLQKTPDFDLYYLKLGELHNWNREYPPAIEYYQTFIRQRTSSTEIDAADYLQWDLSDSKCFAADPDLIKAFFDVGLIYECKLHDLPAALENYLALIRHAPFYTEAYHHFWQVYQQLLDSPESLFRLAALNLSMFWQAYRLLDPHTSAEIFQAQGTNAAIDQSLLSETAISSENISYRPLQANDHAVLTHPGETKYWHKIQSWITNLVISDEEEQSIEQYCEQVSESNYPHLLVMIEQVAAFAGIQPPRCFISRGKMGVSVKNREYPFIFIGSEHLNEENERYFTHPELLFIIAAQTEHIKAGHILITGTELWKSLGTASFDGFLVALQFLPAGSFLGRLTHHFATEGLKRVYKMTKYSTIQKILKFVGRHVSDTSREENEEEADTITVMESETMMREQLVDFARHAVYTADRLGVLVCQDLRAACSAMFKLAGDAYTDLKTVEQDGLLEILKKKDKREKFIYFEYAKRLSELLQFVLSETYQELYTQIRLPSDSVAAFPLEQADYEPLLKKFNLLEQARQNDLLTREELFAKQQHVFEQSGWLLEGDVLLLQKYQQACQDGVLTYGELHSKILEHLTTRGKEAEEKVTAHE